MLCFNASSTLWVTLRGSNFKKVPPTLGATNSKGCHLHWVRQISKGCHLHCGSDREGQISKGCHLHWVRQISKGCHLHCGSDREGQIQKGTTYTVGQTERVKFKRVPPTLGQTERVKFKRAPPTLWVRLRGSNSKGHHLHCGSD